VSQTPYRQVHLPPDLELGGIDFDCGVESYNTWLRTHAKTAVRSGSASVYLLVETSSESVVGYFSLSPTRAVRAEVPENLQGGLLRAVPGYLVGKLAVDQRVQNRWRAANGLEPLKQSLGPDLLRAAVLTAVDAARIGGGQLIVVDAGDAGLVRFYERWGFTRADGADQLRLYLKMSTARRYAGQP
jgi:GNAT superfamily N-acetyltransferase